MMFKMVIVILIYHRHRHIDLELQYVFFDRILYDFEFGEYSDTILLNFNLS
jgi:hypothetical protein